MARPRSAGFEGQRELILAAAAQLFAQRGYSSSTMFKEELEDLKNRFLTRLVLHPVFSREVVDAPLNAGRLDAAAAAGLEVPFSCTSGVCGTCRCKLMAGQVRMDRNFALDKAEVAAGFVLACQAHPLTPQVTLSFDER